MKRTIVTIFVVVGVLSLLGCDGDDIDSEAEARRAYLGLDLSIDRGINLGLDGFNAATSANIPEQLGDGDATGSMAVNGQVDQGASANKGMRLLVALVGYSDGIVEQTVDITYDTDIALPIDLTLNLKNIPDGTFTGAFTGTVVMSGDLSGDITLDLGFSGEIETDPNDASRIRRVVGTTSITGTATSSYGIYNISLIR